ncbi:porin [Burkholderia sp. Ac-20365]|uniref:porin n=1 Tax=Burkholderia sp. Ac-20365 TaxID=2703897 RepID=UPI00197B884B|nr:porin [Burkholderia sp. Ac-20365]MBN3760476.1 porin [Burkholderia sp. Ac-20365]
MKKHIYAQSATLACLLAGTGIAHAQSSVTLYGIIDEGLNYISNSGGGKVVSVTSGVIQGSRWGLRGSEDLGDGLKAVFVIENGFDASNGKLGQGGLEFGRQAWVGLSGARLGTVTLGRQYDPRVDFVGPLVSATRWSGAFGTHPADIDNLNNSFRINNSIKYKSPSFGGFAFSALYSMGGVAGSVGRNQIYSFGGGYTYGPFAFGAAYFNAHNPNVSYFGATGTVAATTNGVPGSNLGTAPSLSGFASASTYQSITAGGGFQFGAAHIGVTYSNTAFKGLGDTTSGPNPNGFTGSTHYNNAEINGEYRVGPALLLGVAYDYMKGSSISSSHGRLGGATYHQVSLGADYSLSKRTDVYVMGMYQHASGTDSTGGEAHAAIYTITPSDSNHQGVVRVGIRHRF